MGGRGASSGVGPKKSKTGIFGLNLEGNTSLESAIKRTNPNYKQNYGYQENCQKCVYVFEMNMRGYNVQAAPTYSDDDIVMRNWDKVMKGQKTEKVGGKTVNAVKSNLMNKIVGFGKDSRSVIYVEWKDGGAHVFNAVRRNNKTKFIDSQIGKEIDINKILSRIKPSKTQISRIDNLSPTSLIIKCVRNSGTDRKKRGKRNGKKRK